MDRDEIDTPNNARDLDAQASAETARAESERRYRLLAENASDVVYQAAPDSTIEWISPSANEVFGRMPEELLGTRAVDLLREDDRELADALRAATFAGQASDGVERQFLTAGGEYRWMSVRARPLREESGTVTSVVVTLRDCHAEVVARRAATTLSAGNAILVNADNEIEMLTEMCQTAVDRGGYRLAWYGRPLDDADQTVEPVAVSAEWRDYVQEVHISWGDNPAGQGPTGTALRTRTTRIVDDFATESSFGPWRDAATRRGLRSSISLPVVAEDHLDGVLMVYAGEAHAFDATSTVMLEDLARQLGMGITRLRAAERLGEAIREQALLGAAIDQAAEAVIITDAEGAIVYANPASLRSSGYGLDEVLGRNPSIFKSGLHDRGFYEAMWGRLVGGLSWHGVLVNRRKNGELYEEDTTIAPVRDSSGAAMAYVALKLDLTVERQLEETITREQNDRDAIAAVMRSARPAATLEGTAHVFCRAVADLDGFDGAMILLQRPDGTIAPVAVAGVEVPGSGIDEGLPLDRTEGITAMTRQGPWMLDLGAPVTREIIGDVLADAMVGSGITAAGYAAMQWEGEMLGVLAVASTAPDGAQLVRSRLGLLGELGSFAGALFGSQADRYSRTLSLRATVRSIIDSEAFTPVFQPIVDLRTRTVLGYEALTRFDDGTRPDLRIAGAHEVGMGSELEVACARTALAAATRLPPGLWLGLNFSPTTIIDGHAATVVAGSSRPLVIEITEHARIENYDALRHALTGCPGTRVSVDDAGAGFASLRHILEIRPQFVKLDIALVRDIDTDPARQALAAGLRHYADQSGTILLGEGVETEGEAAALRGLGIELAQGYLFGRPEPLG